MAGNGRDRSRANLRPAPPFELGNEAATTHGASSERQIRPRAVSQKRRFLRQNGLRQSDLDAVGVAFLDLYARAASKVDLLDIYFDEHGLLDGRGKPRAASQNYFTAVNSARLALSRLDEHLGKRDDPRLPTLEGYLARRDSA